MYIYIYIYIYLLKTLRTDSRNNIFSKYSQVKIMIRDNYFFRICTFQVIPNNITN